MTSVTTDHSNQPFAPVFAGVGFRNKSPGFAPVTANMEIAMYFKHGLLLRQLQLGALRANQREAEGPECLISERRRSKRCLVLAGW
ncbi:hypothetical protein SAMN06295905_2561 [Devosia lucknowensis]|uniref:Uncharacterized protein n=1 Tax=Devosia lucknowensis TaxID=1096929 RepID=A0A1Y6G676_9HYPH|nr:hypothetical protein [Devosia lucknowensis]SMQ85284.1 hypothetical protein SAMN06295905_2561 [Devosia lucknowensis]